MDRASKPHAPIAAQLRSAAQRSGLTQEEIARRAGLSQAWVFALLRGRGNPSVAALSALAQALGLRLVLSVEYPEGVPADAVYPWIGES